MTCQCGNDLSILINSLLKQHSLPFSDVEEYIECLINLKNDLIADEDKTNLVTHLLISIQLLTELRTYFP